ncbi:MAG: hypothetical protein K9M45_05045 [Kiritimatiellales bacterium]|nr:hypothetical protein [Kiritimatiellales bacterium]
MTDRQWETLLRVINGEQLNPLPAAFIIDSPWLPGWYGCSTLDYFSSDEVWLAANRKAVESFPDIMFLPGFWAEYGMCTEPSAFGARCSWSEKNLPHAEKILADVDALANIRDLLHKPDPRVDGLLPFILNRLRRSEAALQEMGHAHRFAVARGPLNIASFLMGTTDFLMGLRLYPAESHYLLEVVTDFLIDWTGLQLETFPTMDGILLLDDIVGFIGPEDCAEFMMPYFKRIYGEFDVSVKFLHNDAEGRVCAPLLPEIGVNLFNFSFLHSFKEMKELTGNKVALLGQIPPRDVLAAGSPEEVAAAVKASLSGLDDTTRIIPSCGGGMPQDVPTDNLRAFATALA